MNRPVLGSLSLDGVHSSGAEQLTKLTSTTFQIAIPNFSDSFKLFTFNCFFPSHMYCCMSH